MSSTNRKSLGLLFVAMATLAVFAACEPGDPGRSTGSYPIDIFQEMHYNQTHKAQEPPRLQPPVDSVPIAGGFIAAPSKAQAKDLQSPAGTSIDRGALLFVQNCSMCHGPQAGGDGPVGAFLVQNGYARPPRLTAGTTQDRSDGEIFWLITNGVVVMPEFKNMLTETERWAVVHYLRVLGSD